MRPNIKLFILSLSLVSVYFYINSLLRENNSILNYKSIGLIFQFDDDEGRPSYTNSRVILKSKCSCRQDERVLLDEFEEYYEVHVVNHTNQSVILNYKIDKSSFNAINCDLFNALRRGFGQKVIGYSLYGTSMKYYNHLYTNVKLATQRYPGWLIRVHYDDSILKEFICKLECYKNENGSLYDTIDFCGISSLPSSLTDLKNTWNASYMHAMKWRWLPIGDTLVDYFVSRDLDAWLIEREVGAVNEWLSSGTLFHVMRDHPLHRNHILGGLWGHANSLNRSQANSLFKLVKNETIAGVYFNSNKKGRDQHFLRDYFYKYAILNATIHDSYHCKLFNDSIAFPTQRSKVNCYLSCYRCCDEKYVKSLWPHKCPNECRPLKHQDWEYC